MVRDIDLLKENPQELLDNLLELIVSGIALTPTQVIMLEACRNVLGQTDGI